MNRGRGSGRGSGLGGRGRGRGGGPSTSKMQQQQFMGKPSTTPDSVPMDMVRPILPAVYPEYADGVSYDYMDVALTHLASDFIHFNDYLRSNFSVNYLEKVSTGFEVDKYTDTYEQPLREQPHLHHVIDKKFFPKELYTKVTIPLPKNVTKVVDTKEILERYTVKEEKHNSDSDEDVTEESPDRNRKRTQIDPTQEENMELKKAAKSLEPDMGDGDDDEDDEADEELDEGNDYMNDYFDNGEGYLSEDDALEEGDVF